MTQVDDSVQRALQMVQASRALRERQNERRRKAAERVQILLTKQPYIPKGMQLRFNLQ